VRAAQVTIGIRYNAVAVEAASRMRTHYSDLGRSVERLSSGLRVNKSADDAAGLSIRELMRAEVAGLNQGIRNANDAVSMIQTADGALSVIDEKLIRMKELAEQAATGTYNAEQRRMIDREFQAMAEEINRIATAADFNGIKLLDGSLSGEHDGSGLTSTGEMKVHFGAGNDAAEDYYYIAMGNATTQGLGLGGGISGVPILSDVLVNGGGMARFNSGIISFAVIPAGSKNVIIHLNDDGQDDTIELFARNGTHISGTVVTDGPFYNNLSWQYAGIKSIADANSNVLTEDNAFLPGATYNSTSLNGTGDNLLFNNTPPYNTFQYNSMNLGFSGSGNYPYYNVNKYLTIDKTTEDLVLIVVGGGF
jgi:flagellin